MWESIWVNYCESSNNLEGVDRNKGLEKYSRFHASRSKLGYYEGGIDIHPSFDIHIKNVGYRFDVMSLDELKVVQMVRTKIYSIEF